MVLGGLSLETLFNEVGVFSVAFTKTHQPLQFKLLSNSAVALVDWMGEDGTGIL